MVLQHLFAAHLLVPPYFYDVFIQVMDATLDFPLRLRFSLIW